MRKRKSTKPKLELETIFILTCDLMKDMNDKNAGLLATNFYDVSVLLKHMIEQSKGVKKIMDSELINNFLKEARKDDNT